MRRLIFRILPFFFLVSVSATPLAAQRTIEFQTTEVTEADVTLSPDGQWLIFAMLGHLFRLPVTGGTAEQLTFGPYYDTDPAISPNGTQVAFVSDRDGSEGNIFVLNLGTGQITQVTHEPWAARPAWSPDGQAIVYARLVREVPGLLPLPRHSIPDTVPGIVRRIALVGGEPETLRTPPQVISSVFYLPDGRLAWAVIDLSIASEAETVRATTRIEVRNDLGTLTTLRTVPGYVAWVIPSPRADGFYCRRIFPVLPWHTQRVEDLLFVPLSQGGERLLSAMSRPRGWTPRFAVAPDNQYLYLGENGRLWRIALAGRIREAIRFTARVRMEVHEPIPPRKPGLAAAGRAAPPRMILDPTLSPDGQMLVFGAAGWLWRQSLAGGPAQRLTTDNSFEQFPAYSPDGRYLAYVRRDYAKDELCVLDLANGQRHTLASAPYFWSLSWYPDGERLLAIESEETGRIVAVSARDGKKETLREAGFWWGARPHVSIDGQWLYFSAPPGVLYRFNLAIRGKPEPLAELARRLSRGLVSPDGRWLAFRRNTEIWVAPLGTNAVTEDKARRLSPEGGDGFSFTPDGTALIYSVGNRVWRHPLSGGDREQIPVRLELQRPSPPPVLLRQVRLLDFKAGGFGPATSVFIEQGRIRWVGSEQGRKLPRETVILDARGRFAIPGLLDMHVHGYEVDQDVFLAYGVTAVRDVGGWLTATAALADRSEASADPVPRYFFAGDFFYGAHPAALGRLLIYDEQDARTYVQRWKAWGVHLLKVYYPLSWPLHRAVAEEARRQGIPVIGHGGAGVEEVVKSVTLGYASLEHSLTPYEDVLQLLAGAGTRWDPTLSTRGNALLARDEPERLNEAKLRKFALWWQLREAQSGDLSWAIGEMETRGRWIVQLRSVREAHRRGVKLLAGTDRFYGPSLHWELEYFVQAGIPPLEVLRIATQEAAAAVGVEDELGTLDAGKLADIVLLDKNPLEDIRNTQTIWRVIKGGWLFDPEKLRRPTLTSSPK